MSPRLPSSPSAPATDADDRTSGRDRPPNRARPSPSRDDANTAYAPDGTAPDGTVDLEYPFGAPPAPPTVAAGVVLVPGRTLRAVDPGTGETRWSRPYGSWTAPAVRDGVVDVPGATGDDGSAASRIGTDGEAAEAADGEDDGGTKGAEDADGTGTLVGLDVRSGEETWRVPLPGRPTGPMAFGNPPDQLFAPALSTDGAYTLVAVN